MATSSSSLRVLSIRPDLAIRRSLSGWTRPRLSRTSNALGIEQSDPVMDREIHHRVTQQFGPVAEAYVSSAGHANSAVLAELVELVRPDPSDRLLDIATGAG